MPESPSAFLLQFDQAEPVNQNQLPGVLAKLTHELAEPLGAIDSIAYYLRLVLPKEDERTQRHLERIEELVASMNATLGDVLQLLRQPAEEQEPAPVVDLHALIAEALAERPANARPTFHLDASDRPATIRLDAHQARQLLRSLFNVFRGLASRCEEVRIRTATEGAVATLEFVVPGLNATRAEVEAMFEPFGRGFAEGSGLALASVRRIFESNGGRITARSDDGRDLSLRGALPLAAG